MWIKGLTWLMEDTMQAATPLQIERYTWLGLGALEIGEQGQTLQTFMCLNTTCSSPPQGLS